MVQAVMMWCASWDIAGVILLVVGGLISPGHTSAQDQLARLSVFQTLDVIGTGLGTKVMV